jgi:serine/threonine protein kinase
MEPPSHIGRYEVLGLLGQGGMGRVFLARDSVLGREVAIKVLRDDLGLPPEVKKTLFERMEHEARAAAALSHPNMVTLHDMGEHPELGLFLVFERVHGPTLRDRLDSGPLPPREVGQLARELGDALTQAHASGVIHRDVKPENVLLSPRGAKLTDFGIARLPDSTLTSASTGAVLGTPAYSAPEALALGEFGAASDQFSLAATLYEALTGRRAFPGDDALTVAGRVALEAPAALGAEERQESPWLSRAEPVWMRGMAKAREERYSSAAALGLALSAALESPPPSATAMLTPLSKRGAAAERIATPRTTSSSPPAVSARAAGNTRMQNMIIGGALVTLGLLVIAQRRSVAGDGVSLAGVATDFVQTLDGGARPSTPAPASTQAHAHEHDHHHGEPGRGATAGSGANPAPLEGDAGADSLATLLAGLPSDDAGAGTASPSTPVARAPEGGGTAAPTPAAAGAGTDGGRRERDGGRH